MKKVLLSLAVSLSMVFTMIPTQLFAEGTTKKSIKLGMDGIAKNDIIYLGTYETYDISWVVMEPSALKDTRVADGTKVFPVISQYILGTAGFAFSPYTNYPESNLKTVMTEMYSTSLTVNEQAAVATSKLIGESMGRWVGDLEDQKWFPMGSSELAYMNNDPVLKAKQISDPDGDNDVWWLRHVNSTDPSVADAGGYWSSSPNGYKNGVRPVFNLDKSAVLFTSAATGGKAETVETALSELSEYSGNTWKLTLKDSARSGFSVSGIEKSDTTIYFNYSGALTGENEYVSAIAKDSEGNLTHYAKLKAVKDDAEGTAEIQVSSIPTGSTVYLFNEQDNGDCKSDYASDLLELAIPSDVTVYDVKQTLNGLTMDGALYVKQGSSENYSATLSATSDYELPQNITVKIGKVESSDSSYDSTTGALTIPATAITGNIEVIANAAFGAPMENVGYDIDYAAETAIAQQDYEVSNDNSTWDTTVTVTPGELLYVRRCALNTVSASLATENTMPARPAMPSGMTAVNETIEGECDGKITGTSEAMEYKLSEDSDWVSCDKEPENLGSGSYEIRLKATDASFASQVATVEIAAGIKRVSSLSITAPSFEAVTVGYTQPSAKPIIISCKGNSKATIESVTVSDPNKFKISGNGTIVAPDEKIETWIVQPAAGLLQGTHTATLTVTYNKGETVTVSLTFTVNVKPTNPTAAIPATPTATPATPTKTTPKPTAKPTATPESTPTSQTKPLTESTPTPEVKPTPDTSLTEGTQESPVEKKGFNLPFVAIGAAACCAIVVALLRRSHKDE